MCASHVTLCAFLYDLGLHNIDLNNSLKKLVELMRSFGLCPLSKKSYGPHRTPNIWGVHYKLMFVSYWRSYEVYNPLLIHKALENCKGLSMLFTLRSFLWCRQQILTMQCYVLYIVNQICHVINHIEI